MGNQPNDGHQPAWRRRPDARVYAPLALALLLSGCGATGQHAMGRAGTAAPSEVATPTPSVVTSVHVLLTSPFPQNHIPSFDRTVTESAKAQHLYDALYALPPYQRGVWCPLDEGVAYHLTFYRDGAAVSWADVGIGGCRAVTLPTGGIRWSLNQGHFWAVFADALGVAESDLFPTPAPDGPSAPTPLPG